jgi:hypothetical protein
LKKWDGDVEWIGLAQDKDRWRAFSRAVINPCVLLNEGILLTVCRPVRFLGSKFGLAETVLTS